VTADDRTSREMMAVESSFKLGRVGRIDLGVHYMWWGF